MEGLAEVLEQELERAFEVKDENSLHRYVKLITENVVSKRSYENQLIELKSDIRIIAETMKQGFKMVDKRFEAVDKRFEAVDKRFEAVDKRFEDMFRYMDKRFDAMDKRFDAVDKRFEDMNRRFTMMFTFMNIGFSIIVLITILFKFLQ